MSIARRRRRAAEKHFDVLSELVMGFYGFLEKKPKPTDEEVRAEFITRSKKWKNYCKIQRLNRVASDLFTKEVATSWRNRYAKAPSSTEKQTQQ